MPVLLSLLFALPALSGQSPPPQQSSGASGSGQRAIAAVEAGDYETARDILTGLIVDERLLEAEALLAEGQARDALLPLDEVLSLSPNHARAWFLRGKAALATAATDSQPAFFYQDALENIEHAFRCDPQASQSPEKLMVASQAAYQNLEFVKALDWGRRGMELIDEAGVRPALAVAPERTLSDASYRVYIEKKQAGEDSREAFLITEDQLSRLLGRTADDVGVWSRLSELYQWEGNLPKAIETVENGLAIVPESSDLHQKLSTLTRESGGRQRVLEAYGRFGSAHPDSPMGAWFTAVETLFVAVDAQLQDGQDSSAIYEKAERLFQRCRQLEPSYEANCISYELICRNGIGWCRYNNGDMSGSKEAFLSMEALKQGGLEWQLGDQLYSGVMGLQFIAGKYAQDGQSAESLGKAAEIFDYLNAYRPEDPDFANNAGFFNRDTAVLLDVSAQAALRRATESPSPEEATALEQRGLGLRAQAQELMERSYAAYKEASRLAPEDVRVVNDTGLIMTYYLRTDTAQAQRYLDSAVEMGERQAAESRALVEEVRAQLEEERARADEQPADQPTEAGEVSPAAEAVATLESQLTELEDSLDSLLEAWGDAHQNLGILYLTITGEPERALAHFEQSVEIGPLPRVPRDFIRESLIPICREAMAGDEQAITRVRGIWHHNGPQASKE